jgi:drug/metabolite transporter (DMT)-like permease
VNDKRTPESILKLTIIISMLLWGLSWPSSKVLTQYCSPINFVIYRYLLVVITLLIILMFLKVKLLIDKKSVWMVVASGVLLAVYSYLFFAGLKFGFAGAGGVLVTTLNPIIAYLLGMLVMRRAPNKNETLGLLLGLLAGCTLLNIWDSFNSLFLAGNLYFLLAAITWAVMSRFTAQATKYGSPFSFSLWMYLVTFLCLVPLMDFAELQTTFTITDMAFWGNMIFSSCVVTGLATTVYFYATSQLGSEKASSYIFMVPLGAAVSSWLFLGEKILIHTIVGGLLGLLAVYIINKKRSVSASS